MLTTFDYPGFGRACVVACLSVAFPTVTFAQRAQTSQAPNLFERGYYALATNLAGSTDGGSSSLCERISPAALEHFSDRYLLRSHCFMAVAQNAKRVDLCAHVLPTEPDGSGISRQECEASVNPRAGGAHYGVYYGPAKAASLLFAMGYGEEDIRQVYPTHPKVPHFEEFLSSSEDTRIVERITRLPDFSKGDEAARQHLAATMPRCQASAESLACGLVVCALLRDFSETDKCIERVQNRFDHYLGILKVLPYKPSSDCPGNTAGMEATARNVALTAAFIETKAHFDLTQPLYAPDAVLWPLGETPVRGLDAIKQWHLRLFEEFWMPTRSDVEWRRVCIDSAVAVVEFDMNVLRRSRRSAGAGELVRETYVVILQQGERQLQIKHLIWRRVP